MFYMIYNIGMRPLKIGKEEYVTINRAAEILGVTTMTLHNWDKRGKLPPTRRHPINEYRLYRVSDLKRLLQKIHTGK